MEENGSGGTSAVLLGLLDFVVVSADARGAECGAAGRDDRHHDGGAALRCAGPPARPPGGVGPGSANLRPADRAGLAETAVALHGARLLAAHLVEDPSADPIAGAADRASPGLGDAAGGPARRDGRLGAPPGRGLAHG